MLKTQLGIYLYCVVRASNSELDLLGSGVNGDSEHIHVVPEGDLAIVVGDAESEVYHLTRSTAMAHQLVIQEVMKHSTALPFSFGTVANTEEEVRALLNRFQQDFLNQLAFLEGKAEYDLKALWQDKDQPFREILNQRDDIRRLRDNIARRDPAAAYQDRIQIGKMVSEALEEKRQADTRRIMDRLEPLAVEARTNSVFTDQMLLNAAFLLGAGSEPAFEEELQKLDQEFQNRLRFRLVGPSPAFNFVRMPIAWR